MSNGTSSWNRSHESVKSEAGRAKKAPSAIRGIVAGLVVVAIAAVVYFVFFTGSEKPQKEVAKKQSTKIKEVAPAAAPKAEPVAVANEIATQDKSTGHADASNKKADTNIVWLSKRRYLTHLPNGKSVVVYVDDPDAPKKKPTFENGLNNFMVNYIRPGQVVPETPIRYTDKDVMDALMEPIKIADEDSDDVKFEKESVSMLREQLRDYIKNGKTAAEFLRDLQNRQNAEAQHVRDARDMIFEALANDTPEHARELYNALNKHMEEKGLPKVPLAKKFLKQMEVTK